MPTCSSTSSTAMRVSVIGSPCDPGPRAGGGDCILTLQSLGEFFHVATRKGKVSPSDAASVVQSFAPPSRSRPPMRASWTMRFRQCSSTACRFWDAMLWATVQQAGCQLLLSEDFQDGRKLGQVTFVNPFEPANQALLDRALPPPAA